jgi:hypothetical protein
VRTFRDPCPWLRRNGLQHKIFTTRDDLPWGLVGADDVPQDEAVIVRVRHANDPVLERACHHHRVLRRACKLCRDPAPHCTINPVFLLQNALACPTRLQGMRANEQQNGAAHAQPCCAELCVSNNVSSPPAEVERAGLGRMARSDEQMPQARWPGTRIGSHSLLRILCVRANNRLVPRQEQLCSVCITPGSTAMLTD